MIISKEDSIKKLNEEVVKNVDDDEVQPISERNMLLEKIY